MLKPSSNIVVGTRKLRGKQAVKKLDTEALNLDSDGRPSCIDMSCKCLAHDRQSLLVVQAGRYETGDFIQW